MDEPFSNGENGDRDNRGRFKTGWRGGPGNPRARAARQLRDRLDDALFKVCSPDRLVSAIDAILRRAEAGDVPALKLLLERIGGLPAVTALLDRVEELERLMETTDEH